MRKFILWNHNQTSSFDFDVYSCMISEVSGLGSGFSISKSNGAVVGSEIQFDDVTLKIHFGVDSNAYSRYTDLAGFIAANGKRKFVLEYQFNGRTLFGDVWFKKLTKSQKTAYRVLEESLTLERASHWYTIHTGPVPTSPDAAGVVNAMDVDLPIDLHFECTGSGTKEVSIKQGSTIISSIVLTININETIDILSDEKRVDVTLAGIVTNGYNRTNKAHDTFPMISQGTYYMCVTGGSAIANVTFSYKKWVHD